jgi:hypothetical protein
MVSLFGSTSGAVATWPPAPGFGVCADTVYKLCPSGDLPHTRILNAIRIVPADLAAFVIARRGGTRGVR